MRHNFHLRAATRQDAAAIRGLIRRVGINPFGVDWPRFLAVVDEQGRLIGCGQIKPHGDGTRELASIAVQPEQQGQGIGTALIDELLRLHRGPLYLICRAAVQPYYERFGFRVLRFDEMSPYFRRISRLYSILRRLNPHLAPLRVMYRDG